MATPAAVETVAPITRPSETTAAAPEFEPMYNVVLLDDDHHTYQYVVAMLCTLLGVGFEMAFLMARAVDTEGRVVVFTADHDAARDKRDHIKSYGPDPLLPHSTGSMDAVIEPLLR